MPPPPPPPPKQQQVKGKGPLYGAGSSGGGAPPTRRDATPAHRTAAEGTRLTPDQRASQKTTAAAAAAAGGEGMESLPSATIGGSSTTARAAAGESKHAGATGQRLGSTRDACSRLPPSSASGSSSAGSHAVDAHRPGAGAGGCSDSATSRRPSGTGSSGGDTLQRPRLTGTKGEKHQAVAGSHRQAPRKPRPAATGSNGEKPQRRSVNKGTGPSEDEEKRRLAAEKERLAEEKKRLEEEMARNLQEADRAIQQLNELGLGEDISYEELQGFVGRLPCEPPSIDTSREPDEKLLDELQRRYILYRIEYCKFARKRSKDGANDAEFGHNCLLYDLGEKLECLQEDVTKLKLDHLLEYLHKEGLLAEIKNDGIFGWSFHYCTIAGLDDYQRIVPQNYGGYEYEDWDTYRKYFHSYEIELEYLNYWKVLLKKLQWMEDYVQIERPSLKWGKILTRGCYQAIKIATDFGKITEDLARGAYYDFINFMCLDVYWYKELDAYFEIWQRITKLKESFRDALNEVYKSNKFPLLHYVLKDALENDCSDMEKEFGTCTAGITEEITKDEAQELIADGIQNQRERSKFYAQYIKKKIDIARAIGVIPSTVLS
ncbi:hypothetical protein ACP4OV_006880 [Aristida adscensionis]